MSDWSHDITTAPRGKTVHSERKVGDRIHHISDFVTDYIWAATQCGKVIKSYWIEPAGKNKGRWSGFANGEQPIAWQNFVVPEHPFSNQPETATKSGAVPDPGETAAEGNCRAVTGGESAASHSPQVAHETMGGTGDDCSFGNRGVWPPQDGASSSRGNDSLSVVTAGETATQFYLEDVGGGA